ncbi:MAG: ParM/StbA family protein [Caloramator sp.]|nr:ParM/StbA family protein [Caloramator sp.]
MILGVDLGNYATKTSEGVSFLSKVSKIGNILKNSIELQTHNGTFYIEEGEFDTEYRKVQKQNLRELFIAAVALSTDDIENQIVVGLPLSQYKQDKEILKELLTKERIQYIAINGVTKKIIIEDVEVYPEGLGSVNNFDGIIIDIGGRTTDIAEIENMKVRKPFSLPVGTLNLYSDFIKVINDKYSLDLKPHDANRILKNGLKIFGEQKDISFALEVFREYVEKIISELQINYSIKTHDIKLTGGGAVLLAKAFIKRLPNAEIVDNPFFANAIGFKKVGESIWL